MKFNVSKIVKTGFLLLFFFCLQITNAQSPQKISYQAVIRNAANVLVSNSTVSIKISILQGSVSGSVVYAETHSVGTNANGLATLEIGGGTLILGTFTAINWANGPYFIKTETDPLGGTNYTISGTNQILSVPYALLSEKAVNPTYPASASDDSATVLSVTARNTWVDDPDISLIVPESGRYLLSFYGRALNSNAYSNSETGWDSDCKVRVFNNTASTELFNQVAIRAHVDLFSNVANYLRYITLDPSRSMILNLNQGDELKIQYNQFTVGSPVPTTSWTIANGGISIIKIGN